MTGYYLTMMFVFALLILVNWVMPSIMRPTLPFGVRIPEARTSAPIIGQIRNSYQWQILLSGLGVALITIGINQLTDQPLVMAGGLIVLIVVHTLIYYRAHRQLREVKEREGWYAGQRQAVLADTRLRAEPLPYPWAWAVPAVLILLATVAIGIWRYPALPDTLAIHYSADGTPDGFADKSVWSAFMLVFFQAGLTLLMGGLAAVILRARQELDVEHPVASARQHRTYVRGLGLGMLVLAACTNLTLLLVSLVVWEILPSDRDLVMLVTIVPTLVGTLAVVGLSIYLGQGGHRVPVATGNGEGGTGYVNRDDDRYWVAGLFYVNRDDPSLMVNKRFGVGWTLNMGHPIAWVLLIALLALPVLTIVLTSLA